MDVTRVIFGQYFWSIIPFLVVVAISLLEACIFSMGLAMRLLNKQFFGILLASNIAGYFLEYFLSLWLNGGHILLVWIPWVRIIGSEDLVNYLVSFPLIFATTLLIEASINWFFLKNSFNGRSIIRLTFWGNLVSLLILILVFNCFLFNFIKGEEVGSLYQMVPEISK